MTEKFGGCISVKDMKVRGEKKEEKQTRRESQTGNRKRQPRRV